MAISTARLFARAQVDSDNAALVALTCLATAASMRASAGGPSDQRRLSTLADTLVRTKDNNGDGTVGWGIWSRRPLHRACKLPGAIDSFGTGKCNPPETELAFQTGLAAICLSQASMLTGDETYSEVARRAVLDAARHGLRPPQCEACFYFMYSLHENDGGRFVRNTSVLMGAAAAWAWRSTGDERMRLLANSVLAAESREASLGNRGYFSVDDPQHRKAPVRESERIENHVPLVAKGLLEIGRVLDNATALSLGLAAQWSWQSCGNAWTCARGCSTVGSDPTRCRESATFSPCFWRGVDRRLADLCMQVASRFEERELGAYMAWALLD